MTRSLLRKIRWVFLDVGGVLVNEDGATEQRLRSLTRELGKLGIRTSLRHVRETYRKS